MKLLLQRVRCGKVTVHGKTVAEIGPGLVVLVGFGAHDTADLPDRNIWQTMLRKMLDLRIFPDSEGKMNRSLSEFGGQILLVPQFTLYADTRKGRRPSFTAACPPGTAERLFSTFASAVRESMCCRDTAPQVNENPPVQCGIFGADMDVSLTNWGPVTISLTDADYTRDS
ncbi:D-aminoacyl-tRNA deacylase [Desulfovibrio psychrotolerans]|uniref:D-aminoacyl-tRNA deacylase n=1 Tax=Desulfovibrio psychrotolerans TaxID=415242 RepID=A0A7J0BNX3_9BACT|nr:D-aminoacyl-tRNA deacylase [Desulfovibrio psychrotolerans]GFM35386.1 D-aminoacyl-tRNA deacylase [Desulfovibrio psychrotolerans]